MKRQLMQGTKGGGVDHSHPETKKERAVRKMVRKIRRAGFSIDYQEHYNKDAYDVLKVFIKEQGIV